MKKINLILNILIFGTLFALLGTAIPSFYYEYIDNTVYYEITEVGLDAEIYSPGDYMELRLTRTSLVDSNTEVVRELSLINSNASFTEIYREESFGSIDVGSKQINTVYKLPEPLEDGEYFWRGTMIYEARGRERVYTFTTPIFTVLN